MERLENFRQDIRGEPDKITTNILYMQGSDQDKTDFFANARPLGYF